MKIINRYVLKEHVGPFIFSLSALTSVVLLQYIARKFGDLVGRGLSWQVITEFLLLSVPFTIAMTLPMAVLVAVLYAFSRLASENEITALRAGGVSTRALMLPALVAGTVVAIFMLWFNDQVLPAANHQLAALQTAIFRTKPTFALKPQVINTIKEGQLYLRAGQIDEGSGLMKDVTIYDLTDARRRRTVYADSGTLALARNHRDLMMHLYHGMMISAPLKSNDQLNRIYYRQDLLKVAEVTNTFQSIDADTTSKGQREMSVCEMQAALNQANLAYQHAYADSVLAYWRIHEERASALPPRTDSVYHGSGGIGALYCAVLHKLLHVREAQAAEVPPAMAASQVVRQEPGRRAAPIAGHPRPSPGDQQPGAQQPIGRPGRATLGPAPSSGLNVGNSMELSDASMRLNEAERLRNSYSVEIEKKFSLAAACIVFVIVGAPIALRFPRGGVGLVISVSFAVFGIYYVGLIGGESLADKGIIPPFWAMWGTNVIFLVLGVLLMLRMGNEGVTARGGSFGEMMDATRAWFAQRGMTFGAPRSGDGT